MTPEEKALRDAYMSELWPTCRELPDWEREAKRLADEVEQARMAGRTPRLRAAS